MAGGGGFLDLERHFAFYGAYHSNPVNVFIHALFVWPIFLTALLLLHLAAPFPRAAAVFTAVYGAFYVSLDRRSGALAALLCLLCWAASSALAARLGFSVGWKKRAPALIDNLVQALMMAPYFVLLEILHKFAAYEPYPGFHANVQKLIDAKRKEWADKKAKKMS
uniref:Endoplasmic reticulum membrane protein C16E8.02 n=1 Tax=Aegilops tauschii TaxID=37682 RepID=M8AW40_AEGTA